MSTSTTTTGGRRERKKIQTRATIVQSAWLLFQQKGVASTSIRAIAELADVSDTTVLNYFANKDELVEAVVDLRQDGLRRMTALLLGRPAAEPPATALRAVLASLSGLVPDSEARDQLRLWRTTSTDPDLYGVYLRQQVAIARELAQALSERAQLHGQSPRSLETMLRAALAAIDAVAGQQPDSPSGAAWVAQVDDVLARLERGWCS